MQWDPANVQLIRRLLLWLTLLALTAGVLYLIWVIAYSLGHGDQAVSHSTTALVVVRVEPTTGRRFPYVMAAVAVALTAIACWAGWRQRGHHA